MKKAMNFALIHFSIAFMLSYLLTGDLLIGSLVALLEPGVNTLAFYLHERVWQLSAEGERGSAHRKTISFTLLHFTVAWSVGYLITGDLIVGGLLAILEPCCNSVAYYFFERRWQSRAGSGAVLMV